MKLFFFSMRTFEKDGGGSIRMYGVLNELAEKGHEIIFISNAKQRNAFHPAIKHIPIGMTFSTIQKTIFQGLLGIMPFLIIRILYGKFIKVLKLTFEENGLENKTVLFFEYLDNSIGYLLKRSNIIKNYINDIHGVATVEFKYQVKSSRSYLTKLKYGLKYLVSNRLDYIVFNNASGFIFASRAMEEYFIKQYPTIRNKQNFVLSNALSSEGLNLVIDQSLKEKLLNDYEIKENDFVFLFVGGFKATAGVQDLINAFAFLLKERGNIKLLLIGRGAEVVHYSKLVNSLQINYYVRFIRPIPYSQLRTYQDLAHVIVCPDRLNIFSELIVHLKYFDALASGKVVINSSLKSINEINIDDKLSISFKHSDVMDLVKTMEYCINNYAWLVEKYSANKRIVAESLTYKSTINALDGLQDGE